MGMWEGEWIGTVWCVALTQYEELGSREGLFLLTITKTARRLGGRIGGTCGP